jgi:hypothetical protein
MRFEMPLDTFLDIVCSDPEIEPELDEEVEGVFYTLVWNDRQYLFSARTRSEAYTLALGIQYGAKEMNRLMMGRDE